jgi:rubrerythrin
MTDARDSLERRIHADARIAIECLAGAERAVLEGRLNIAKILRAEALAARQRALALERLRSKSAASRDLISGLAADADGGGYLDLLEPATDGERAQLAIIQRNAAAANELALKSASALERTRDVPETAVAQFIFGCTECGHISETRAEVCPSCGALGGDVELFAPFFSSTNEHISRRQPREIVALLQAAPGELRQALSGVSDEALRWRPADSEWCMKEIAGHMIDIAELFCRRVAPVVDEAETDRGDPMVLPWTILDGRGYPDLATDVIAARFAQEIERALTLTSRIADADWRKPARMLGSRVRLIDMGSWLANHNVAHLQQVIARRDEFAAATT